MWGVLRDGLPNSSVQWSAFAGDAAAAGQVVAVFGLLIAPRLRQPRSAWLIGAIGIGVALLDAGLWTAIGGEGGGPIRYVRQIVVAVGFAAFAAVLCRHGIGWALRGDGGYDLVRVKRVYGAWPAAGWWWLPRQGRRRSSWIGLALLIGCCRWSQGWGSGSWPVRS